MKKVFCDICGKEIKKLPTMDFFNKGVFFDMYDEPLDDLCEECFYTIYFCLNMMKKTGWRPSFNELLESDNVWTREKADNTLYNLEKKTGWKL